ncbi:MAG: hypothetical protein JJU28_09400 [Cyclobacteriaceae bacterium]|nr:hypothetical protein [Cyclobacteriaceae bacterium]
MGNNPVMMVDPDGELVILALAIGAVVGATAVGVIAHNNGQDWWKGAFKGALVGVALTASMGKAGVLGAKAKASFTTIAKSSKLAGVASNSFSGAVNMANNYDSDKGLGHMLGNFAAGYVGSAVGIGGEEVAGDVLGGFFTGGVLTGMNDMAHGRIDNEYSLVQSFVGGGLSTLAGKSFNGSISEKWGIADKYANKEIFAKYGLQNVASNFAYDKKQEFFKKPLAIHGAAFMVGGIGASVQEGIMEGNQSESEFFNFSKRFGLSMLTYGAEYSSNYYFKTKMQQVKYGDYRRSKGASYGVKSFAYSWLYTWY